MPTYEIERRVITRPGRSRKNGFAPRTLVVWAVIKNGMTAFAEEYPTRKKAEQVVTVARQHDAALAGA